MPTKRYDQSNYTLASIHNKLQLITTKLNVHQYVYTIKSSE